MPAAKKMPAALQQKVAQTMVGTAPSLIPPLLVNKSKPAMQVVSQGAVDIMEDLPIILSIDELVGDPDERKTLQDLISAHLILNANKKIMEKKVEALSKRIKIIVGNLGISQMQCAGAKVNYFPTSRRTINPTKLLASGVEQDTIDLCTDVSTSYTLNVTAA